MCCCMSNRHQVESIPAARRSCCCQREPRQGIERLRAQRRKLEAELSSVNAQIAEAEEA